MKKRFVFIFSLIFLLLIILVFSIIYSNILESTPTYTSKHVNMDKIRKDNFIPGKEAALDWAHVYVDLRGNGSTFTKKEIASELKAWGYTEDEIKYAISHIN